MLTLNYFSRLLLLIEFEFRHLGLQLNDICHQNFSYAYPQTI